MLHDLCIPVSWLNHASISNAVANDSQYNRNPAHACSNCRLYLGMRAFGELRIAGARGGVARSKARGRVAT